MRYLRNELRFRSIAARLTAGLGLIALVVFGSTSAWLQYALTVDLKNADLDSLGGKVKVVVHFASEAVSTGDIKAFFHHLDDLRIGHEGMHVALFDRSGRLVYGDARMPASKGDGPVHSRISIDGRNEIDMLSTPLPATSPWPGGKLSIGLDTGRRKSLLDSHLRTLIAVSGAGVALTALLSWFATRRSHRVIRSISREAMSITPATIGTRLSDPAKDAELSKFISAFNAVLARLHSSYGQMQAFNANVAHELRTPLATLINGSQVTLSAPRSRDELHDALTSNLEELEHLKALVNDMLFLARADNGDRAEGLETVFLGDEADKAIQYCEALLHESQVEAVRRGNALVSCSPGLIHRALANLLTNAIRHTAPRGRIEVLVETVAAETRLAVSNPGPPIPPTTREGMFDRFFRGDTPHANAGPRLGLGLAIVAAIARMHGGTTFIERRGSCNVVGLVLPNQGGQAKCGTEP